MPRGGARKGAGRPKKEPTKRLPIPISMVGKVKEFIKKLLSNEKTN